MAYLLRFGGVDLPSTLRPDGGSDPNNLGEQDIPRGRGGTWQRGRKGMRLLEVRGELTGTSIDDVQAKFDTLKAAVFNGIQDLYFGRDDRRYRAQVSSWSDSSDNGILYNKFVTFSITFKCNPPDAYAASGSVAATGLAAGGTVTVSAGNTEVDPLWTFVINAGGTGTIILTNTTTGEIATIAGTFINGDIITLDRDTEGYTVKLNGTVNAGIMEGRIPGLNFGANVITVTPATVTLTSARVDYIPRYA